MQNKYFQSGIPGMFFYGINAYFITPNDDNDGENEKTESLKMTMESVRHQELRDKFARMAVLVKFYGGQVISNSLDPHITHVIMDEDQDHEKIKDTIKQFIR